MVNPLSFENGSLTEYWICHYTYTVLIWHTILTDLDTETEDSKMWFVSVQYFKLDCILILIINLSVHIKINTGGNSPVSYLLHNFVANYLHDIIVSVLFMLKSFSKWCRLLSTSKSFECSLQRIMTHIVIVSYFWWSLGPLPPGSSNCIIITCCYIFYITAVELSHN